MVAALRDEMQQLRTEFETYRKAHPEPVEARCQMSQSTAATAMSLDGTKTVLAAVHSELTEKERRKRNAVVSGLIEADGTDDVDSFCKLCETCLLIKPSAIRERCHRLGKNVPGKVQPLLATLSNEKNASELLQCARLLRRSPDAAGLYINADLTPAENLAAYQARERRRARRSAVATDLTVISRNSGAATQSSQPDCSLNNSTTLSESFPVNT